MKLRIVGLGDSTTAGTPGFLSPLETPQEGRGNPEKPVCLLDEEDPPSLLGSPDGYHPDVSGDRSMGESLARVIEAILNANSSLI